MGTIIVRKLVICNFLFPRCGPIRREKQYQRKDSLLYTPSRRRHSRNTGCYVQECEQHDRAYNGNQIVFIFA